MRIILRTILFLILFILFGLWICFVVSGELPFLGNYFETGSAQISAKFMTLSSFVMIFLMLITIIESESSTKKHIEVVEKISLEQINSANRWTDIKRKQLLKSLIRELNQNLDQYELLLKNTKSGVFPQTFSNFILVCMKRCLSDSPIDDKEINYQLMVLYYVIKLHDNKIAATRTPNIKPDSLKGLIGSITEDYKLNKQIILKTIKMISEYEQNIQVTQGG